MDKPRELKIKGCIIETSCGTGGKVIEVSGPHPPDSEGRLGGYTIVYAHPRDDSKCWINEVFVENGQIYAHVWRDKITVIEQARGQLTLF